MDLLKVNDLITCIILSITSLNITPYWGVIHVFQTSTTVCQRFINLHILLILLKIWPTLSYNINAMLFIYDALSLYRNTYQPDRSDSNQSLGQRWVMVGVVGNTSLLAWWHWPIIGPTLKFQQLKYCCWPNVSPRTTQTHQRWILSSGANDDPTHACRLY